jgi:hypothetical protein
MQIVQRGQQESTRGTEKDHDNWGDVFIMLFCQQEWEEKTYEENQLRGYSWGVWGLKQAIRNKEKRVDLRKN